MMIELARSAVETMQQEADKAHPCECCGILLGREGRVETALPAGNVHPEPERHFEIDPQALFDAFRAARAGKEGGGPQVLGYYHSHPIGEARPSATDQQRALRDGSIWAIVAGQDIRLWRDGQSGFTELPYRTAGS